MRVEFPYLMTDEDRHGNRRVYVRHKGRKIRLREPISSEGFAQAYADALRALDDPKRQERPILKGALAGTLGWLAASYFLSAEFRKLDPKSQVNRRQVIEACLREPRKPGSPDLMRDCPIGLLTPAHVKMLRDRKDGKPGAGNNRRKYLSSMFGWAIDCGMMRANPAREVRRIRYATSGFHTWTVGEVSKFETRHPIGSKARLALALLLLLGVRRGDVVRLGRQHIEDEFIRIVPNKTRYQRLAVSHKPILPLLADIIAKSPTGALTFLETEHGKPFTAAGFGNWFADRCIEAKVPGRAHGLRKAGATIAAENGATDRQLMALYDWTSEKQANGYTAAANRKRMAAEAARRLIAGDQIANRECPTDCPTVPESRNSSG